MTLFYPGRLANASIRSTFVLYPNQMAPEQMLPAILDQYPLWDGMMISRINVPAPCRNHGYGRTLLQMAIDQAVELKYDLYIVAESSGRPEDMDTDQLDQWYSRMGFVSLMHHRWPGLRKRPFKHLNHTNAG